MIIADAENAKTFEWNFGDGTNDITSVGQTSHTYTKAGTYSITLTIQGDDPQSVNSIIRKVYVTSSDTPFALINLKSNNEDIAPTPNTCNGEDAYIVDRVNLVTFS